MEPIIQTILDAIPVLATLIVAYGLLQLCKFVVDPPKYNIDTRQFINKRLLSSLE